MSAYMLFVVQDLDKESHLHSYQKKRRLAPNEVTPCICQRVHRRLFAQ